MSPDPLLLLHTVFLLVCASFLRMEFRQRGKKRGLPCGLVTFNEIPNGVGGWGGVGKDGKFRRRSALHYPLLSVASSSSPSFSYANAARGPLNGGGGGLGYERHCREWRIIRGERERERE